MDSVGSLLNRQLFNEPEEIAKIKQFLLDKYNKSAQITVQPNQIIIQVSGAAFAGSLRMDLDTIKNLCNTDKKLIIRIGG